ncbi:hypothetical protein AB0C93_25035 [Streptomyces sp. NPDC048518]|uniref:hypothetical protein n=1 Tax=Streptomyces sp. NPDC048518 TaxID=3155029 RepID=UPI0034087840
MLQEVSTIQQIGVAVLAVATVVWAVGLVRVMRRERPGRPGGFERFERLDVEGWGQAQPLHALPVQQGPPRAEAVELTADERDAFAGLVRQFGEGRGRA